MAQTFQDFIASERSRLNSEREAIFTQQQQLDEQLAVINQEMHAIDAYEAAKTGKAPVRKAAGTRGPAPRRGSKRDGILAALKDAPAGLTRGDLLEKMGLKGNKSGEMSVSNALTALTKAEQVVRKDGKYVASMG
jgi:hypothetical protein